MVSGEEMNPHAHRFWEGRAVVTLGEDGLTGHPVNCECSPMRVDILLLSDESRHRFRQAVT